mgnify:CR=1 FL=1
MSAERMQIKLTVWRQNGPNASGGFKDYALDNVSPDMSFLEMLDTLNEQLVANGEEPVAFDHDCREGICGSCGMMIDGVPHGPERGTATCQLHMRKFNDGETVVIEPWRAKPFPVVRDLVTDRSAFDRIIAKGGFVSVRTGGTPDANANPVAKKAADEAMDAAACIGCGACVAACPNAAAMLFVGAKISHLRHLPQGQPEKKRRVLAMVKQMDEEGFGACTNYNECEAACPKDINRKMMGEMFRDYLGATLVGDE